MTRRAIPLTSATSEAWLSGVLADFNTFLADHANCERKASAMAMGMVVKYPDRPAVIPPLIALAQEELAHFAEVYELMCERGVALQRDTRDDYVGGLMALLRHGRDERFLDRLLMASLVECRGTERFGMIADALTDPELAAFYDRLRKSEAKHGHVFAELALRYFDAPVVYGRLEQLAHEEAVIVAGLELRAALH